MPLKSGSSQKTISSNISELRGGATHARTEAKFGKKRANAQSVAIALSESRKLKGRAFGGPMTLPPGQALSGMLGAGDRRFLGGSEGAPASNGVVGQIPAPSMTTSVATPISNNPMSVTGPPPGVGVGAQVIPSAPISTTGAMAGAAPLPMSGGTAQVPMPSNPVYMGGMAGTTGSPVSSGVAGAPNAPLPPYGGTPNNASMSGSVAQQPYQLGGMGGTTMQSYAVGGPAKGIAGTNIARAMTKGPILSAVPGRTDKHFTHVPSGSFVIPADIVSGHGQGNTLAGANNLQSMFKMGPYGSKLSPMRPSHGRKFNAGGSTHDANVGVPVPVKLAGGEIVVPPEHVLETMERIARRKLTLKEAHEIMDKWVVTERKKLRKTLAGLPPPSRD